MTDTITTTNASDPVYWLNRDDAEARRLVLQGRLYYPSTRWILLRGGIRPA